MCVHTVCSVSVSMRVCVRKSEGGRRGAAMRGVMQLMACTRAVVRAQTQAERSRYHDLDAVLRRPCHQSFPPARRRDVRRRDGATVITSDGRSVVGGLVVGTSAGGLVGARDGGTLGTDGVCGACCTRSRIRPGIGRETSRQNFGTFARRCGFTRNPMQRCTSVTSLPPARSACWSRAASFTS